MTKARRSALLTWGSVVLLAALCAVAAFLQYRWLGEISETERQRLREDIRMRLLALRQSFNETVWTSSAALQPERAQVEANGPAEAYAARYAEWKTSHRPLFRRIAFTDAGEPSAPLYGIAIDNGTVSRIEWPSEWGPVRDFILARTEGRPPAPLRRGGPALIVLRQQPRPDPGMFRETEWLILELDVDYIARTLLPTLLNRHLRATGTLDYDAEVAVESNPDAVIFKSYPEDRRIYQTADASTVLLDEGAGPGPRDMPGSAPAVSRGMPDPEQFFQGRGERGRGMRGGRRMFEGRGPPGFEGRGRGFGPGFQGRPPFRPFGVTQRWRLSVRNKAGSLEILVQQARRRNLAASGGILLLILTTVAALVRVSRQAQSLAELQMNIVAGVSHELRTPLTVIRTAAFNLRGKLAHKPDQVEQYGQLIQEETEKLAALVEQVLRFARAESGDVIRKREPVDVAGLVEKSVQTGRAAARELGLEFEIGIDPDLPPVLADELAMKHALQNVIDNAVKYGGQGGWIGIFASTVKEKNIAAVEIRVADRGPGIPPKEQKSIFDPFYRGRRAIHEQIHGAGLGLDLVRRIVEAHEGSVRVESAPGKGTQFIVRIPAASPPGPLA